MIPRELIKKIRRIQITTSRIVNDLMAGQYHSAFKGRGMEFSEVREYIPGDDIRTIDWNVTARFNKPFVKRFVEERELTVMFLNDISGSQAFGSAESLKSELAAEISAVLAFSAIRNNDQVGSILFSDRIESYIPPKKGAQHVLRVVRDLLYEKPAGRGTNIAAALEYLNKVQKKRAVVFLVSDFKSANYEKALRIVNKRHDLVGIIVDDPREMAVPKTRWITFEDAETGRVVCVDLSKKGIRDLFEKKAVEAAAAREKFLASAGVDFLKVSTGVPYEAALYRFMQARSRRMMR
jgi:uncharacterized protein (DUF58 family)